MTDHQLEVIAGVDTHADTHTAVVIDEVGRMLGHRQFPTTVAGYRSLLAWVSEHGGVRAIGIEGTGSYGVGLARYLRAQGVHVVEVDRPNRKMRRQRGKSDPIDAEAAARAVLAGTATTTPKTRDGQVEAIRVIRTARASAVKSRTAAMNALIGMVRTAPEPLRTQLLDLRKTALIMAAAALRPALDRSDPVAATKTAVRRLARRIIDLDREIRDADVDLQVLLTQAAPRLMELPGVGPDVVAQLLISAGDNPSRIRDERGFAALCGVSPIPASSGRTDRHRLNRGGDRTANRALYIVAINRMRNHEETLEYVARRREKGLSSRDISRCLKRYIARQVYPMILESLRIRPPSSTALAGA
ncbi:IS110 family transposase [Micromonospora avicenniae]|uniref:Transposase n=1 Tax=Micromonospora avicenniae TaxID=1198245 RepID=A0A1N7ER81_9ACTN|nr:IS110 family transposase [Micromonospora avicenniae]SIR90613.1 Transposase [Micromonospora avicenniae]